MSHATPSGSRAKILIDCDPGHDDAVAILYAASHFDLVGVTTVYGNQTIEKTTRNALSPLTLLGRDIPVASGCAGPLNGVVRHGGDVHGESGIDSAGLPSPDREVVDAHAIDFIIEMARRYREELVLCPIGPFTNVGMALRKEPRLAGWLRAISVMGGTTQAGNTTSVAEFNVWCDPEAADIVFRSGVPLWMVGLNVTRQVGITAEHIERLLDGDQVAQTFGRLLNFFQQRLHEVHGLSTASLHDPCALMPFIASEWIDYRHCHVEIALGQGPTRGMTVCDLRTIKASMLDNIVGIKTPNCHVAIGVQAQSLVEHTVDTIMAWSSRDLKLLPSIWRLQSRS